MPANGQSLLDLTRLPEGADDLIQASIVVEGDPPVATLADEAAVAAIYNRCTDEQRAWALPQRRPPGGGGVRHPGGASTRPCSRRSRARTC